MNLIDLIPACAGMTRVVCAWAITPLCHREEVKRLCGDPVNKKALRAFARRHIITGLPQSYANVFNVSRSFAMTAGLVTGYSYFTLRGTLRVTSPHPPSRFARHPPPPQQGRWAFVRPTRRIIVILSILGRWGLDHPGGKPAPLRRGELIPQWDRKSATPFAVKGNFVPRRELGMFMSWGARGGDFQAFLW